MKIRLAFYYGMRNLLGRSSLKAKSSHPMFLPIIGIALSLMPVIVILEVSNGMIEGITARLIEFDSGHLNLTLSGAAEEAAAERRLPAIMAQPGVTGAFVSRQGGGIFFFKNQRYFVRIRAVPSDFYERDRGFRKYTVLSSGSFSLAEKNSIVIGKALAEEFGVTVGDSVLVFTHQIVTRGDKKTILARPTRFTVRGIYSIGYQELDKLTVFISSEDGKKTLASAHSDVSLMIKVSDPFTQINRQAVALEKVIDPEFIMFWRLYTWQEMNSNYFSAYESTKILLIFIMIFIVFVAAFNIISSMKMMVLDRFQEIGILKSVGASSGTITLSFIVVGFFSGLISTLLGVSVGLVIAVNINEIFILIENALTAVSKLFAAFIRPFFGEVKVDDIKILNPEFYIEVIPIRINFWEILFVSMLSIMLAVLFSLYHARIAGNVRPLEVIRRY